MTAIVTQYAQQVSTLETSQYDGLSVRDIYDLAAESNNYQRHVACFPLVDEWCIPHWGSPDSADTTQTIVFSTGPRYVPDGFNTLCLTLGHYRTTGSGDVTWTVYCSATRYAGPQAFSATLLSDSYGSATITTSSATHAVGVVRTCAIDRGTGGVCYIVLTATNTSGSAAALTTVDIAPIRV